MRGFRLFERPLSVFSSQPTLYIQGSLPDYAPGEEYEGRLQFFNSVGRCHVEIVEEDTRLPDGATAIVDNFSKEIVLRWPAFSPPEEEKTGIVNWDFELGDLTGWKDLRGNSWDTYVYDITTDGVKDNPYLPAPGNIAARMTGAGRGDHVLESDLYPVTPGAPISARALWYQGPSNKDNNNLWTAIQFYTPGKVPLVNGEVRGDRIHDRTNKARHWSSVNTSVPAAAGWASVKLIAGRRNSRNRLINVDDVETTGFHYTVGTDDPDNFFQVRLRLVDSANRVAYWSGVIVRNFDYITSALYPIFVEDSLTYSASGLSVEMVEQVYHDTASFEYLSYTATGLDVSLVVPVVDGAFQDSLGYQADGINVSVVSVVQVSSVTDFMQYAATGVSVDLADVVVPASSTETITYSATSVAVEIAP